MSVETTRKMWISVPVKLVAGRVLKAICLDQSVMEIELHADTRGNVHLYTDEEHVFSEPGE